jgi:hypothetical protein
MASVTTAGYATALYWPLLNQICEARRRIRHDNRNDRASIAFHKVWSV